ncbi:MAG: DUF7286 family protein, partial [Methanosarcinaceae archaeon]
MQNPKKSFLKNNNAWIPFAVIGAFIVVFAVIMSLQLLLMDIELAILKYETNHYDPEKSATNLAAYDLKRCLNYAGMEALQWQGKHPIIQPEGTHIERSFEDGFVVTTDIHNVEPGDVLHITLDRPFDSWYDLIYSFQNNITVTIYDSHNISLATFSPGNEISTKKRITIPHEAHSGFGRI